MELSEAKKTARVVEGNTFRIKKLMRRAMAGEDLHIGFLGGSITQGSLSTAPELCYAYLVYKWWQETFPESRFTYINGGIGGTTSLFGAARAWMDVMRYRPDFVIVDFTVNDEEELFFEETYEGVIRQICLDETKPAVMLLHNVYYDDGRNAQKYHQKVGEYYQIPAVSMRESLYRMIQEGNLKEEEITPDHLHPNDAGHRLLADILIAQLESIYDELLCGEEEPVSAAPLTANRFERAKRWQITNSRPMLDGFFADGREKRGMLDLYKNGWTGIRTGDSITFSLEASCIAVQFLRSVKRKSPMAEVIVDKDREHAVLLDGNFDEDWGDCLYLKKILDNKEKARHTLEIRIIKRNEAVEDAFYLVSVITD